MSSDQLTVSAEVLGDSPSIFSNDGFALVQRMAKAFSTSSLVPEQYRGDANIGNCIIALNMAHRIGADPLMVMQNLYVVHGRPSWSSQFLIATFNNCGRFSPIRYEMEGEPNCDEWGCRAVAIDKETGEILKGTLITIALTKAEGWYAKNGSKWKTMPEQMLKYRAAAWFVRTHAPEISMGLHTAEEVRDEIGAVTDARRSQLNDRLHSVSESLPVSDETTSTPAEEPSEDSTWEHRDDLIAALKEASGPGEVEAIREHFVALSERKAHKKLVNVECEKAKADIEKEFTESATQGELLDKGAEAPH